MQPDQTITIPVSKIGRIVQCPGSRALEAQAPPREETDVQREGTAAHWVFETLWGGVRSVKEGDFAPNKELVTEEMLEGADMLLGLIPQGVTPAVEESVDCSSIHPACRGRPDLWFMDPAERGTLVLVEYKFGHRFVNAIGNYPLLAYGWGLIDSRPDLGIERIRFVVVQPRCYHRGERIRTHTMHVASMRSHKELMQRQCREAMKPMTTCAPGPECGDCKGSEDCVTLQHATSMLETFTNEPDHLTVDALGRQITFLEELIDLAKARLSGLEERAYRECLMGNQVPGRMLQPTTGRLNWTAPLEQIVLMGELNGVSVRKDAVLTPTQAIKAGLSEAVVNAFAERKSSTKLVKSDNSILSLFTKEEK